MDDELKSCPLCGHKSALKIDEKTNCATAYCTVCLANYSELDSRSHTDREKSKTRVKKVWNHRTPEPGTSIIRWTRYDGTPETLPKTGSYVLLYREKANFTAGEGECVAVFENRGLNFSCVYFPSKEEVGEKWATPVWLGICSDIPEVGDLWSYLPNLKR